MFLGLVYNITKLVSPIQSSQNSWYEGGGGGGGGGGTKKKTAEVNSQTETLTTDHVTPHSLFF